MRTFIVMFVLLLCGVKGHCAYSVSMVKDIEEATADSNPHGFQQMGEDALFLADGGPGRSGLWKYSPDNAEPVFLQSCPDGQTAVLGQKFLVFSASGNILSLWQTDRAAGNSGVYFTLSILFAEGLELLPVGDDIFFLVNGHLWFTDGTAQGTEEVESLELSGFSASHFIRLQDRVGFFSYNGTDTLWIADQLGAHIVKTAVGYLASAAESNGCILFETVSSSNTIFLWRSDGTPDGTYILKEYFYRNPQLATVGTNTFFVVPRETWSELWKTDGTDSGTIMVSSFDTIGEFSVAGGFVFFAASQNGQQGFWRSNGTTEETIKVGSFYHEYSYVTNRLIPLMATVNEDRLFIADDGNVGNELWRVDSAGTVHLLKDVWPGKKESSPDNLFSMGNYVLFCAENGLDGRELWRTDGTTSGTEMLANLNAISSDSSPANLTAAGNCLYFSATTKKSGIELWKSDGTEEGTSLVKDIYEGSASSYPSSITAAHNGLYFGAITSSTNSQCFVTDGSADGTRSILNARVLDIATCDQDVLLMGNNLYRYDGNIAQSMSWLGNSIEYSFTRFIRFGNEFLIPKQRNGNTYLHRTAGNPGDVQIATPEETPFDSPSLPVVCNNKAFFMDSHNGLSVTDGTPAGTSVLVDSLWQLTFSNDASPSYPDLGSTPPYPGELHAAGNYLFFVAWGNNGRELWVTDGTPNGEQYLQPIGGFYSYEPDGCIALGNVLIFSLHGRLWRSDGTVSGTHAIGLFPGPEDNAVCVYRDQVFYGAGGYLYVTDGTTEGTSRISDTPSYPSNFCIMNDKLYFAAYFPDYGRELGVLSDLSDARLWTQY